MINSVCFLTSNKKKAEDFTRFGLGVKEFSDEIIEVLSPDVETVVLYKAKDAKLNNIVVEDTSLEVEDADFYGTQIKHVYEEVKEDNSFNGKKAIWRVSICMKKDDYFYISTGELDGILKYPALDYGYHFDRIFAVWKENNFIQFEDFSQEEKMEIGPRYQAIKKLVHALNTNDFSQLRKIHVNEVPEWMGEYQVENEAPAVPHDVKKNKM